MFEEAGTTRDAVDAVVEWPGGPVRFVDTAGMRRQTRVQGVEYFSFVRATDAIERAHVAMLVIDATQGFTVEDKKIAEPRDGGGSRVPARREQVGPRRREGQDATRTSTRPSVSSRMRRRCEPRPSTAGRSASGTDPARPPHRWNLRVSTAKVNAGDPASAARTADRARREHAALRHAGERGAAVVRRLRRSARARRRVPALPRESPAQGVRFPRRPLRSGSAPARTPVDPANAPPSRRATPLRRNRAASHPTVNS